MIALVVCSCRTADELSVQVFVMLGYSVLIALVVIKYQGELTCMRQAAA